MTPTSPAHSSQYTQALEFLYARTTGGVKFGLDRTLALLAELGDPHRRVPCFHVAGTNGKGSTVAALSMMLRGRGLRVATYTSPHLIDFRERIVVDGTPISEDQVVEFIHTNVALIERLGATFFEATTAMAFDYIARSGADAAVIETGLGGRLDSTNVVDPVVAVVTSIGLDHMELLGSTLESIAGEKAGIFKPGRPAIIGERDSHIRDVLEDRARALGARPVRTVWRELELSGVRVSADRTAFTVTGGGHNVAGSVGLIGSHQPDNALTAWLALDAAGPQYAVPLSALSRALVGLRLPGRFDRVGNLIFDVAHNPAGASVVASTLSSLELPKPLTALVGVLSDKDWRTMLRTLSSVADQVIATVPPTAPPERRWHLEDVRAFAQELGLRVRTIEDFDEALRTATETGGTTLITGSFHTVGDAMSRLQVNPLAR